VAKRGEKKKKRIPIWVWIICCLPLVPVGYLAVGPSDTIPNLLCPNGEVTVDSRDYELDNGERGTTYETYCVEGNDRRNINNGVGWVMMGTIIFAVLVPTVTFGVAVNMRRDES
jgi:hypothetical protein